MTKKKPYHFIHGPLRVPICGLTKRHLWCTFNHTNHWPLVTCKNCLKWKPR